MRVFESLICLIGATLIIYMCMGSFRLTDIPHHSEMPLKWDSDLTRKHRFDQDSRNGIPLTRNTNKTKKIHNSQIHIKKQASIDSSGETLGGILEKVFRLFHGQHVFPAIVKRMYDRYLDVSKEKTPNAAHKDKHAELNCDWKCLVENGLEIDYADFGMLQWILHSNSAAPVLFWPEAVSDDDKMQVARGMVSQKCGKIIYEKTLVVNQHGLASLAFHAYGQHSWLNAYVKQLHAAFPGDSKNKMAVLVMFVTPGTQGDLELCKTDIRTYFDLAHQKSSVHIPDYHNETVLMSEMILNPNSVMFMNHHQGESCRRVAREIGRRLKLQEVNNDTYMLPQTMMIDSGAAMSFFGIRKTNDVDILFHGPINHSILGEHNGFHLSAHKFQSNRARSDYDLFLDPANFGYCHGMKFVSIQQLILYKRRRGVKNKDEIDVASMFKFLNSIGIK